MDHLPSFGGRVDSTGVSEQEDAVQDFIPGGTTQNQFKASVVKRFGKEVELNAWVQYEGWKAPAYKPGLQQDTSVSVQLTWYPKLRNYPEVR